VLESTTNHQPSVNAHAPPIYPAAMIPSYRGCLEVALMMVRTRTSSATCSVRLRRPTAIANATSTTSAGSIACATCDLEFFDPNDVVDELAAHLLAEERAWS
jgi:hypothetical protein